jgi:hypothetical protein
MIIFVSATLIAVVAIVLQRRRVGGALRNPETALTWFARKPGAAKPLATA